MYTIRLIRESDADAYWSVLGKVCRERRFLGSVEPPDLETMREFVATNVRLNRAHFVALDEEKLVGWCDAIPGKAEHGTAHLCRLGMGVRRECRGRKIGQRLLEATIDKVRHDGLEKIELSVYASNAPAIALYRKYGFVEEGCKKRGRLMDGVYDDVLLFGLDLRFDG